MKANELMIGDWYKWYADGHYYNYQVTKETFGNDEDTIANFEPIPLTKEILENNGFINDKAIFVYEDETKVVTFFSKENNRPYCNSSFINIDCGCVTLNELPIEYVHELQHALRLCGIEKEIEL